MFLSMSFYTTISIQTLTVAIWLFGILPALQFCGSETFDNAYSFVFWSLHSSAGLDGLSHWHH